MLDVKDGCCILPMRVGHSHEHAGLVLCIEDKASTGPYLNALALLKKTDLGNMP